MEKILAQSFENVNCDVCQENNYSTYIDIQGYEKWLPPAVTFSIVRCNSCGLLYTNPRLSQGLVEELGREYFVPWGKNKNKLRLTLSSFIKKHAKLRVFYHYLTGEYLAEIIAKSEGRVLDIGCGFGDLLEDLSQKGCIPYGIEINPLAVRACREKGLNVSSGALDEACFPDNFFDTVTLSHVIEHLPRPKATLRQAYRILKPGGKLLIYCPNADSYLAKLFGKYWQGWSLPFHFYHFTKKTIQRYAELTGFRVKKISSITPEYISLMSIARYLGNNHNRFLLYMQKKGIFSSLLFRLFISFIFRLLDLSFPGKGECLRVELVKPDGN